MPKNSIVVQKYGGTSVGNPVRIQKTAERISKFRHDGWKRLAIVVSAMAGETNRLVALVKEVNPKAPPKSYDLAVAAGEQVSVGLMAAALEAIGVPAEPLLGYQLGIITDDSHGRARIKSISTHRIEKAWSEGKIPVVAGFQGVTQEWDITTLGRGGSDTSAVALAVALGAAFCEINTDVSGIYTSDPRVVPEAKLIEKIGYEVALELAASGGKVMHSRSVEIGAKFGMPIVVRNTFDSNESRRTEMVELTGIEVLEAPVVSAVTMDLNIAKVTLRNFNTTSGNIFKVFSRIAIHGVNVDIIVYDQTSASSLSVGFTVPKSELDSTIEAIETFKSESGLTELSIDSQSALAKVSAVGLGMSSHPGVASKIFEALNREGIPILMVSTSEIKISFVVNENDAQRVTQTIHPLFF